MAQEELPGKKSRIYLFDSPAGQIENEVRLMEDKVRIMRTRIDNAEYFRRVCGPGYSGSTGEELKIEEAKLEGLYEKERREKRTKERIEQLKKERQKGEPYDKHTAMCNGVPVW